MAVRVTSDVRKNQIVGVNDAQVWFDDEGTCIGIIGYADGTKPAVPDPLRDEDIAVFSQIPHYTIDGAALPEMAVAADAEVAAEPEPIGLADMSWPEVQKLAADHEIKAVGRKRAEVEADLRKALEA